MKFIEEVQGNDEGISPVEAIYGVCEIKRPLKDAEIKELLMLVAVGLEDINEKILEMKSGRSESGKSEGAMFILN